MKSGGYPSYNEKRGYYLQAIDSGLIYMPDLLVDGWVKLFEGKEIPEDRIKDYPEAAYAELLRNSPLYRALL